METPDIIIPSSDPPNEEPNGGQDDRPNRLSITDPNEGPTEGPADQHNLDQNDQLNDLPNNQTVEESIDGPIDQLIDYLVSDCDHVTVRQITPEDKEEDEEMLDYDDDDEDQEPPLPNEQITIETTTGQEPSKSPEQIAPEMRNDQQPTESSDQIITEVTTDQPFQNQTEQTSFSTLPSPSLDSQENGYMPAAENGCDRAGHSSSPDLKDKEFVVEKILDKKLDNLGFAKFLVKWEGYPVSANSWEPLEYLVECDEQIQKFETQQARKLAIKMRDELGVIKSRPEGKNKVRKGTLRKYQVSDIMGITQAKGEKYYLISLVNSTQKAFIRTSLAKKMIPDKVIDFYLKHIYWKQRPQPTS